MKKKFLLFGSYVLVAMLATVITLAMVGMNPPSKLDRLEALIEDCFIGEADFQTMEDAAAAAMVKATGDRWSYYISAKDYDAHREQEEFGLSDGRCDRWRPRPGGGHSGE